MTQRLDPKLQSKPLTVRLDSRTYWDVHRLADRQGVTPSSLVRTALATYCTLKGATKENR